MYARPHLRNLFYCVLTNTGDEDHGRVNIAYLFSGILSLSLELFNVIICLDRNVPLDFYRDVHVGRSRLTHPPCSEDAELLFTILWPGPLSLCPTEIHLAEISSSYSVLSRDE